MQKLLVTILLLVSPSVLYAEAPIVPSAAPYIVLSDNLDEPNKYGFCIDTLSRGKTDLMQTHSCKPSKPGDLKSEKSNRDNDTRFMYIPDRKQIESFAFKGFCMQALIAAETTVFALLECSDHPRQRFIYSEEDKTIRLDEDRSRCLSVASKTVPAGPWVKRALRLETCENTDTSLRRWNVVTK